MWEALFYQTAYNSFNILQTHLKYFNLIYGILIFSDEPLVVCAPTGSGKTVLFELAILRLLQNIEIMSNPEDFKIVYSKYQNTVLMIDNEKLQLKIDK